MPKQLTQEEFETRVSQKYDSKYSVKNFTYVNGNTVDEVICSKHNITFKAKAYLLVSKNLYYGCTECKREKFREAKGKGDVFVQRAKEIHGEKYDYSEFVYVNNKTKGTIICKLCSNEWETRPDTHLHNKSGCPICNVAQIYTKEYYIRNGIPNHSVYLYLLQFESQNDSFCKIGLTKHEKIKYRFRGSDYSEYTIHNICVAELDFFTAYDIEQDLKLQFQPFKKVPKQNFKGKTECFEIQALEQISKEFTSKVLHARKSM